MRTKNAMQLKARVNAHARCHRIRVPPPVRRPQHPSLGLPARDRASRKARDGGVTRQGNTRPRDFYDIHVLWRMKGAECDPATLHEAIDATCAKRGSTEVMGYWDAVLSEVAASQVMQNLRTKYIRLNSYAAGIALDEACETARGIMRVVGWSEGAGIQE